jgi:competence protein ComEA
VVKKEFSVFWLLFAAIAGSVVTIVAMALARQTRPAPIVIQPPPPTATALPAATVAPIRVYVNGAVNAAGVYELPAGSILADAVALAGDLAPEAAAAFVNLALPLSDGMHIYIPSEEETPGDTPVVVSEPADLSGPGPVNINTATAVELETLPGVGPATAQKIIAYRDENGPFATIEDIMLVAGIGEVKFDGLKELITVH